jgi:hypothetical protein
MTIYKAAEVAIIQWAHDKKQQNSIVRNFIIVMSESLIAPSGYLDTEINVARKKLYLIELSVIQSEKMIATDIMKDIISITQ